MSKNLTIGVFDIYSLRGLSGSSQNLVSALEIQPSISIKILPCEDDYKPKYSKRLITWLMRKSTGYQYLWEKEPARCRYISMQLDNLLQNDSLDAVLMFGSEGCACSTTKVPIYCYADSIFGTRVDLYADQKKIHPISIREGIKVQQSALNRVSKIFISSKWAVQRALDTYRYRINKDKFVVVGIGANLPVFINRQQLNPVALEKNNANFIWVGVDWSRKGGDFAVQVVSSLRFYGYDAHLHIVGPIAPVYQQPWIHYYGRLNYSNSEDYKKLEGLYKNAYALLLPTQADITPVAIAEAAAFGRPTIASPLGGIPEMIIQEKTGLILTLKDPCFWAKEIIKYSHINPPMDILNACFRQYYTRLNWNSVAQTIVSFISSTVNNETRNS
jgi:glycosyltransferase involved in cell wall biosynthesis